MTAPADLRDSTSEKSIEKASIADVAHIQTYDADLVKKTWRKVDMRIMPISCLLYLASYIDR